MTTWVERGTVRLASWAVGDGPGLVALHAGVADSRAWRDCVPAWTDAGWQVVTFDRRGFGDSTWEAEGFRHVDDLLAAMWLDGPTRTVGTVGGSARELFLEMNGGALRAPDIGEETWADDSWNRLDELDVPILVVAGAHDVTPGRTEELVTRLPGAALACLEDSAHLPMLDDPATFLAAVEDFLAARLAERS